MYHFKNLVFEGGGVKGIAYIGAIDELRNRGILDDIQRVAGTSAGAINAILVGLNYSKEDIEHILMTLDFTKFMDDSLGIVRDTARLIEEYGWYKGDYFRNWIGDIIKNKTGNADATFYELQEKKEELGFKDLYFIGTNLSTGYSEVFSHEHTPDMAVADAVRISMSIPIFFASKRLANNDVYVDGGVLANYPIKIFDRQEYVIKHGLEKNYYIKQNQHIKKSTNATPNLMYNQETLGFKLDSYEQISIFHDHADPKHKDISNFAEFAISVVETIYNNQSNNHLHTDDWHRTIYIDSLGIKTTEFDLDDKQKRGLIQSGSDYTIKYFKWFDDLKNTPCNRPE